MSKLSGEIHKWSTGIQVKDDFLNPEKSFFDWDSFLHADSAYRCSTDMLKAEDFWSYKEAQDVCYDSAGYEISHGSNYQDLELKIKSLRSQNESLCLEISSLKKDNQKYLSIIPTIAENITDIQRRLEFEVAAKNDLKAECGLVKETMLKSNNQLQTTIQELLDNLESNSVRKIAQKTSTAYLLLAVLLFINVRLMGPLSVDVNISRVALFMAFAFFCMAWAIPKLSTKE